MQHTNTTGCVLISDSYSDTMYYKCRSLKDIERFSTASFELFNYYHPSVGYYRIHYPYVSSITNLSSFDNYGERKLLSLDALPGIFKRYENKIHHGE